MTILEKIDKELVLYKEYLGFKLSFTTIYEVMLDFEITGNLFYTVAIPSFNEWLEWNNYPSPNDKG